ncbi:hypothetical protein [Bizionia paragorgiae]|uniref:GLPGLI family protein n=1 Tax=Bizionia paragorgiae TaxID=283786 RepID=A0A1H4B7L1_BIZPA|nr:hypothetical protein [Bizionia paragorgiae]SEA44099.1 hypothetical protein SAMN04487990_11376 [Bizionia paragorgiae]
MKKIIFLTLLLLSITAQAKDFYNAKIVMTDGTEKTGFAPLPSNDVFQKSIKFKSSKNMKSNKIKSNDISSITYTSENGIKYLFERRAMIYIMKSFDEQKNIKYCDKAKKTWILATSYSENIISYYLAQKYYLDNNGKMISKSVDRSGTWADIFLLVRRPDESCASMLGHIANGAKIIGQEKRFRKVSSIYFKDKPELVKRINKKEFKSSETEKLIKAYNDYF